MEWDENELVIFFRNGEPKNFRAQKKRARTRLVKIILDVREKCLTKKT